MARVGVDFQVGLVRLESDDGRVFIAEMDGPAPSKPNVPVVYLDQLHWISLARSQWSPDKLEPTTVDAASQLIEMAEARKIVLPVSAAHLTELPPNATKRRRELTVTILQLSRGWQLRNPIAIREDEYSAAIDGKPARAREPLTLEPNALFSGGTPPDFHDLEAPPGFAEVLSSLTAICGMYAALLEETPFDQGDGPAAARRWAAQFPALADHMRANRFETEQARLAVLGKFLADQRPELVAAGKNSHLTAPEFDRWIQDQFPGLLPTMPSAGRFAEMLYLRLRNSDEKWEPNDLNDMSFLSAAAGYADVVVAERKAANYLLRSESRVSPGAHVVGRLEDAAGYLTELVANPERRAAGFPEAD